MHFLCGNEPRGVRVMIVMTKWLLLAVVGNSEWDIIRIYGSPFRLSHTNRCMVVLFTKRGYGSERGTAYMF